MKNLVFKSVLVALCAIAIVGCERWKVYSIERPCPSHLDVSGTVKNEDNISLEFAQVNIKSVTEPDSRKDVFDTIVYADKNGEYSFIYAVDPAFCPTKVSISVKDTTGVYETQEQTLSVIMRHRYPEDSIYINFIDGFVTADFVMKKK